MWSLLGRGRRLHFSSLGPAGERGFERQPVAACSAGCTEGRCVLVGCLSWRQSETGVSTGHCDVRWGLKRVGAKEGM